MKAVIQRVSSASVTVDGELISSINNGLLVLLGIASEDTQTDIDWLVSKIVSMRIFNDVNGVMNISLKDSGGDLLVVSQFTLHASTKKGNRPSYIAAAKSEISIPLYEKFIQTAQFQLGKIVHAGRFGADMKVALLNDGPVTIVIDTADKL
jgi:D-tyrosyl-tRNA(Tyr) deacylase